MVGTQKIVLSQAQQRGKSRMEKLLFPTLGGRLLCRDRRARTTRNAARHRKARWLELASKTRIVAGMIFRYAIQTAGQKRPARDLRGALKTRETQHYAKQSMRLPEFLRKLDAYDGNTVTKLAN